MQIISKINRLFKKFVRGFTPLNLIEISESAILHNYDLIQKNNPKSEIWPVLKGNAYGHGIKQVTQIVNKRKPTYVMVDSYFEALKVWEVCDQPVLLLAVTNPVNFKNMKLNKCAVVVYDMDTLYALGELDKMVNVHLKVNTGMNRQGIEPNEIEKYVNAFKKYSKLNLEGVCTHMADADGETDEFTNAQQKVFSEVLDKLEVQGVKTKYIHVANTAGSTKIKDQRVNAIRLGIGLYGLNVLHSSDPAHSLLKDLKPALRFTSTLTKVRELKAGDSVGYNCTFKTEHPMQIGLLPVGYYEVYDRRFSNSGFVKFGEEFLPIVGRISMNLITVDLKDTKAKAWDKIEIISPYSEDKNSVLQMAQHLQTIPYEILTRVSETVRRVVVI